MAGLHYAQENMIMDDREDRTAIRNNNARRYIVNRMRTGKPLDPYYILGVLGGKKA